MEIQEPDSQFSNPSSTSFTVTVNGKSIQVYTQPGLPEWNLIAPATNLLVETVDIHAEDTVLLYGCNHGALAVYLAQSLPPGHLIVMDNNLTALQVTRQTLAVNEAKPVTLLSELDLYSHLERKFTTLVMQIPKGRALTRRWLVQGCNALLPGGKCYIAGANSAGIQSILKDASELWGAGRLLGYKKGNRVGYFLNKTEINTIPAWAQLPGISPGTWVEFSIYFKPYTFNIHSLPGVFSHDHLDEGTQMLLEAMRIAPGVKVLDAGCGYGIIGMAASLLGAGLVQLVDNNALAILACRETLSINHIANAEVIPGDMLALIAANKYDVIVSNPPFHSGQAVDYQMTHRMISLAFQALNPGGQLLLVANRFIRYDRIVEELFGNVTIQANSGKFHVLSGLKSR